MKINQVSPISIAQITDTHLFAAENHEMLGMPTIQSFQAVVDRLKQIRSEVDLLLLTGDLSGDGKPDSYDNLQNLVNQLQIPAYWIPGNHDCAIAMEDILNMGMVSRRKSFHRGGWNFILLDSSVPGCLHGHLSGKTLDWLDSELKTLGDAPTLVALHHPPFPVNSAWLDSSTSEKSPRIFCCSRPSSPSQVSFVWSHPSRISTPASPSSLPQHSVNWASVSLQKSHFDD